MPRTAPYNRDVALDAALSLFWDKGFHATSLKDLEGALSMKPGSIYSAFSSKSNLYLLALERYFEATMAMFAEMRAGPESPLQALADKLRNFAALPQEDEQAQCCMLMKTLIDTRATEAEISNRAKLYLLEICDTIAGVFEKSKALGEIPADADTRRLARRYQSAITSLRFEIHRGNPQPQIKELADDLAQEFERLRVS